MKFLRSLFIAILVCACTRRENSDRDRVTQTTVRAGSSALFASHELLKSGDFGVGLRTNGVLIIDGTTVYLADENGRVTLAPINAVTPFAIVTYFENDRSYDVGEMDYAVFRSSMDWKRKAAGRIHAFRVTGTFSRISRGALPELQHVRGTLSGFCYPDYLAGVNEPGYELFFLDEARAEGGHATDFTIKQARIEVDECTALSVGLPASL